jgi:phospholipid/cholesterol/gamma-HCH transport system ATP-binding protein
MGMVFQGSALFDSMTIAEIKFPLRMFKQSEMNDRQFCFKVANLRDAGKQTK